MSHERRKYVGLHLNRFRTQSLCWTIIGPSIENSSIKKRCIFLGEFMEWIPFHFHKKEVKKITPSSFEVFNTKRQTPHLSIIIWQRTHIFTITASYAYGRATTTSGNTNRAYFFLRTYELKKRKISAHTKRQYVRTCASCAYHFIISSVSQCFVSFAR